MSIYRDDDEALALRDEHSARRERAALDERDALIARYSRAQQAVERDEARLAAAGDGAGPPCPRRDRAALMPAILAAFGLLCLPVVFKWAAALGTEPSVAPALALLAVPGLLAALVAWPYRRDPLSLALFGLGVLEALAPLFALLHFAAGRLS